MGDSSLTENIEIIINKEECYEVIDECTEVETSEMAKDSQVQDSQVQDSQVQDSQVQDSQVQDSQVQDSQVQDSQVQDSQAEVATCPKSDTTQQDPETDTVGIKSEDNIDITDNTDKLVPVLMECDQESNNDTTDFTADIDLDQFDGQKDVTDEDVMHHLDVIENIELDPETFCVDQCMKEINQSELFAKESEEQVEDKDEITVIEEEFIEVKWYEKKLAEKNCLLKERLSKLARVLTVSYPSYNKWLERIQKIEGSPICKIDPIRRCSLKKPNTNRWKFQCRKKIIQESIKPDPDSPVDNFKSTWNLEPIGIGSATAPHITEFPSFVLKAVKIFEDFLQTTISATEDIAQDTSNENLSDDTSIDIDTKKDKDIDQDKNQHWLCLLVRCNSKDELMLFATGKNINRSTMDRLKQTYESGSGRNCNVKSLYCKSMNKRDDKIVTTFLVGAEALDETVGNLKVQLAPKTNFWCNAAGAWNVAKTVADMLEPTKKITILEIGCGIGVIGLTIASKCREVIGVDSPSEIEEAEMTCELNNIYNASFIMGSPSEIVTKLNSARDLHNKNRVTYCIVNAGTNMGRAIEVMTCLRKISSLRRIVMVTTLTKQSVRAILELARPIETGLGHPFMPIRACVVDTLPTGPHFEVVILMERRLMHRLTQPWFIKMLEEESKTLANTKVLEKIINNDKSENTDAWVRKNPLAKPELLEKSKALHTKKITKAVKNSPLPVKGKLKLKRDRSPDIIEINKIPKKIEKVGSKSKVGQQDVTAKKKTWFHENSNLRINPLFEKKTREIKEQVDLREKLLSNRIDTDLIQKVNESREILEAAKEKLSGPSPTVDATTAKELKNVLSLVLDQTNKIQAHLPRSVWDRIAPPEPESKTLDDDPLLKGRFVQETRAQDIVITTANKEYLETEDNKPKFKKYHNLAPLEPNMVMPVSKKFKSDNRPEFPQKSFDNRNRQQNQDNSWNKNKGFDRNRWSDTGSIRRPVSPMKRQNLSFTQRASPSDGFSSKRPLLSPPRRLSSPSRRHLSPDRSYQVRNSPSHREYSQRRPVSPIRVMVSDNRERREMSPLRRPFSPINRMSPPRRPMQVSGRPMSPMRRHISPPRPQLSPPRRQISPMEYDLSARQLSPERRPMSPIVRMMSPSRPRDLIPPRHQSSPMRHFSPHQAPHIRNASPPRRQQSPPRRQQSPPRRQQSPPRRQLSPPRRQSSPPNRFADEWDIPSRGAIEQSSTWQRSVNERPENIWRNERQPTTSGNWQALSDNDKYRKPINQDKPWDGRESSSHGNSWNVKQSLGSMKEPWQTSDNRWSGPSRSGNGGENWNRDSLGGRNKEPWMNTNKPRWEQSQSNDWNQGDKDDWNDLPEDARDPWGDDGNLGLNRNIDNQPTSSTNWSREVDKDSWGKSKDNWQNKSQIFPAKSLCQNSNNPSINDSRWLPLNDMNKKVSSSSTNWQGGTNVGSNIGTNVGWQSNYGFQTPQRSFVPNLFKDRR
ncbi:PREDICTED: uncharacterized protein LOC108762494 isoform X2 [Trachymyrmex cornetzi]|uniref:uncharacterized protein LOC108762494 isoform X2 n=1 Tax=Trachymyrmex cornetzi TaxID=471704 RepID=UPI00084F4BF6|nr:PREDICTED: uncharacterized protein LOC108762494 isoform X2 [Trachymyrmex cornetzi]